MGADEFRDYILGFIFYKYLSERMHLFANEILKHDGIQFDQIDEATKAGRTEDGQLHPGGSRRHPEAHRGQHHGPRQRG